MIFVNFIANSLTTSGIANITDSTGRELWSNFHPPDLLDENSF